MGPTSKLDNDTLGIVTVVSVIVSRVTLCLVRRNAMLCRAVHYVKHVTFPIFTFLVTRKFVRAEDECECFFALLNFTMVDRVP